MPEPLMWAPANNWTASTSTLASVITVDLTRLSDDVTYILTALGGWPSTTATITIPMAYLNVRPVVQGVAGQRERMQEAHERVREAREERERVREPREGREREAHERAVQMLLSLLDDEGRERFEADRRIEVTGSAGGRYAIEWGYAGNIRRLDRWPGTRYCAHPPLDPERTGERLPIADVMTCQMLMLLTDEPGFLGIANVT